MDAAAALALSRAPGLAFFSNRLCPFAHRAWWAMHEKGVAAEARSAHAHSGNRSATDAHARSQFTYVHVDLGEDKPDWYKDTINPAGTVPCIFDAGKPIFESHFCVEYLEDKFPGRGTPLLPPDAAARAAVRLFVSSLVLAPYYAFLMEQDRSKDAEHIATCTASLAAIEARYAAASADGPFFLGAELSAADIALLPFVMRFSAGLGAYRGWDVAAVAASGVAPRVAKALAAASSRPAWRATAPEAAFVVQTYAGYATGKSTVLRRVAVAAAK